jgi:16S rRNA processing protein RimM
MGRVGAPYGVKGWLRVVAFTAEPDGLAGYGVWWIRGRNEWREVAVAEVGMHGPTLVAKLAGCADRESAAELKGSEIAVPRDALPETAPGEYYWSDLVGADVVNGAGETLGQVAEVFSNGAHEILRVVESGAERRERLLPFLDSVVTKVDLAARRIEVDWGLDW